MIPAWVKPGVSFDVIYGNSFDTLWHVRGLVDDQAVLRRWLKHKRRWQYDVKDWSFFDAVGDCIKVRAKV